MSPRTLAFNNLYCIPFCSLMLFAAINEYEKNSKEPIPFSLLFIILPIIFHAGTRECLPKKKNTSFPVWVRENSQIRISLSKRAQFLLSRTFESIEFLIKCKIIEVSNGCVSRIHDKSPKGVNKYLNTDDETAEIYSASKFLGRWFGRLKSQSLIFGVLGVKP